MSAPIVEALGITKDFPGVRALDGVDFRVHGGEILGLVGENGAGKSTLMRVLSGVYPHGTYGGTLRVDGGNVRFANPLDAEHAGIAIIHQELSTFPHLTVAENIFAGHLPRKGMTVDWKRANEDAGTWLAQVGASCAPTDPMGSLSIGTQQLVEIAKALSRQSRVIILDEPTSALSQKESEALFGLLFKLRERKKGLIYISHKMEEIFRLCDRLTVLRDGKSVHEAAAADLSEAQLIGHMVGREVSSLFPPREAYRGERSRILQVKGLCARAGAREVLKNIDFELHAGEIFGLAGLLGSGRSELLLSLFGAPELQTRGELLLHGRAVKFSSPREALENHIAFVAEDRKHDSIFPGRSLEENAGIGRISLRNLFSYLSPRKELAVGEGSMKELRVKTTDALRTIETLSGGNQQKVILARALQIHPRIVLLDEPTRGVDVGAKYEIYEILFSLAKQGFGLIVVSGELPELIGLCDRIGVMKQGRMEAVFDKAQKAFDPRDIMRFAV